jgi:hypothetical protein
MRNIGSCEMVIMVFQTLKYRSGIIEINGLQTFPVFNQYIAKYSKTTQEMLISGGRRVKRISSSRK